MRVTALGHADWDLLISCFYMFTIPSPLPQAIANALEDITHISKDFKRFSSAGTTLFICVYTLYNLLLNLLFEHKRHRTN